MKRLINVFILILFVLVAKAQTLRLPRFFSDGMVVQRDAKNPVWGWGKAGETVIVSFAGKTVKAIVNADGTWKVYMPKVKAGGPYEFKIQNAGAEVVIKNVLVGDVFLCSGQSNMELPIRRCMDVVANEVKDYSNDNIRYLKLPHQFDYVNPRNDVIINPWQNITPENCAEVSGICYFMARELQASENVPIGIINSAVGGTRVEAWTPKDVLKTFTTYKDEFEKSKYNNIHWVDSVRRAENQRGYEWEANAVKNDTIVGKWNKAGYDFSQWHKINIFSNWFNGNGSYWFRKVVNLQPEYAGKKAIIRIGAMKDADSVFVNGTFIGNTTYEYPPRIYTIPEGLLKSGDNEVMVHLMSQNGRGNFTKGKLYQIEIGELVFPLGEEWQMAQGSKMMPKPGSTYFVDGNTGLYNAMIAPFQDMQLKGMLWYQGESNLANTSAYADHLEAMVKAWRKQFGKEYPFVIMQLPGYQSYHDMPFESGWTQIREQQYLASQRISKAGLAPTLDTGEFNDIHPQDKKTAGHRAALQMQRLAYGKKIVSGGPMPVSAKLKDDKVVIMFSKETGRLRKNDVNTFSVKAGDKYQWADAQVTGDYTVTVSLPECTNVTSVRYCWDDYPSPSLYNIEGIPAPQFQVEVR